MLKQRLAISRSHLRKQIQDFVLQLRKHHLQATVYFLNVVSSFFFFSTCERQTSKWELPPKQAMCRPRVNMAAGVIVQSHESPEQVRL